MKAIFTLTMAGLLIGNTSCTRIANRVAYGKPVPSSVNLPKTPVEAVNQATQVKRAVDQYTGEKKQQERQEKENQYAAIQEQDQTKEAIKLLKLDAKSLRASIEPLVAANAQLSRENDDLHTKLSSFNREIDAIKQENQRLTSVISVLSERVNTLELSPAITAAVAAKPAETVNLGEMAIVGGNSIRKAPNGSVSVRSGTTNRTYTPKPKSYTPRSYTPKSSQYYTRGPRGGCYYITGSGRKQYVDRSLCD